MGFKVQFQTRLDIWVKIGLYWNLEITRLHQNYVYIIVLVDKKCAQKHTPKFVKGNNVLKA